MKNLVVILFLVSHLASAQEKLMCITVDDLPMVSYGIKTKGHEAMITKGLLDAFTKYGAPAIGYVNENKLYRSDQLMPDRVAHLENWLQSGYELGNHTFSHKNYHRSTFEEYSQDILLGQRVIKELAKEYKSEVRYFRHPYLRMGKNKARADSLEVFLSSQGYTISPVTIDNEEYLFAKAFAMAYKDGDSVLMDKIGSSYLEYMETQLKYYEKASDQLFGRNIAQTLLIHANLLNATYLDKLLAMYRANGYSFVSQGEVLKDPAYQSEITKFSDWGISWIQRWGMSNGLKGDFFKGEAVTPAFIKELAAR